ncbi:unnamed protein product [Prunus armeniaca]
MHEVFYASQRQNYRGAQLGFAPGLIFQLNLKGCMNLNMFLLAEVLFAEASKEVVDFLFTLLSLHVAIVTRLLLSNGGMVGCLGKLYESLENLSDTYMQHSLNKDSLLKPKTTISGTNILHLPANNDSNVPKWFYLCANCNRNISDSPVTTCPTCISLKISNKSKETNLISQ